MFKGLRNKFLIILMGIVSLIVVVFFSTILLFNYQNMDRNADIILNGMFKQQLPPQASNPRQPPRGARPFDGSDMRDRLAPIFTIELDEEKNITSISSMFELDEAFYQEIAADALAKKSGTGLVSYDGASFKYRMNDGKIVFLDISKEMQMFMNTVYTFLWIAVPLLAVIFLFSLYFANRSIRPIEEAYNRQKEFVADASHELKTPLAVIATNADMLLSSATEEQQKWLTYIRKETERMAKLTGRLLYLTKLDYTEENTIQCTFDCSKIIENYLMQMDAVFFEQQIQTEISIQPDVKINGDSEQLRQLVSILIDNAIKYTDGILKIRLERVGGDAVLTLYNTGKGIAADELPLIWNRFYRGDKSRENTGGFGLGLSIAKEIANRHNGSIEAESAENKWTRFIVKIPSAN